MLSGFVTYSELIKEQGTKSKDDTVLVPYSLLLNQIRIKE